MVESSIAKNRNSFALAIGLEIKAERVARLACQGLRAVDALVGFFERHGADERGAYEAQLGTLLRLGMQPDSAVYIGVVRSMNWVLKARERDAANARRAAATSDRAIADAGPVPSPGR